MRQELLGEEKGRVLGDIRFASLTMGLPLRRPSHCSELTLRQDMLHLLMPLLQYDYEVRVIEGDNARSAEEGSDRNNTITWVAESLCCLPELGW